MPCVNLDSAGKAVEWILQRNGYRIEWAVNGPVYRVTATHAKEPTQTAADADPYAAICQLAELCGLSVDDG